MITTILSDLSRVILFPKDKNYKGTLNGLYKKLQQRKMSFNFLDYFKFNDEILNLYTLLKNKHISICMFTTGSIQNAKEVAQKIDQIFDNVFSAKEYSLDKKEPSSYKFIATKLQKPTNQILYIDDQLDNIKAAEKARMDTWHYKEFADLYNQLKSYLK